MFPWGKLFSHHEDCVIIRLDKKQKGSGYHVFPKDEFPKDDLETL